MSSCLVKVLKCEAKAKSPTVVVFSLAMVAPNNGHGDLSFLLSWPATD